MHWKESLSLECKNVAGVTLKATKKQSSFLLEFPRTSYLQIWGTDWKVRNGVYRDPVPQGIM